jgi:Helix-turn-helix domain/RodZ C-terminal domain
VIRPRGGATRRGDSGQVERLEEPAESVGTRLRHVREERGLDLLTVHDRLDRPITQIEALERDDHAALPDASLAGSTLRRYATLLGLDGDALSAQFAADRSAAGVDADVTRATPPVTSVVAAVTAGPDHLKAFTETGEVPQVGGRVTAGAGASGNYGYSVTSGPPTGTFPVVPRSDLRKSRRSVTRARRRMKAATWLKVLTWAVAVLVLAVAACWVLMATNPRLLANAHILRVVPAGSEGGRTAAGQANAAPGAGRQIFPVVPSGSTASGASYTVATTKFDVVIATSGRCWVQVTSSSSPYPLVSGVQDPGKVLSYRANGTMTVEVGSSAVVVGVTIKGKSAFTNAPQVIPFTYTFAPA